MSCKVLKDSDILGNDCGSFRLGGPGDLFEELASKLRSECQKQRIWKELSKYRVHSKYKEKATRFTCSRVIKKAKLSRTE